MPLSLEGLDKRLKTLENLGREPPLALATDLHDLGFVPHCLVTRSGTQDMTEAFDLIEWNATTYDPEGLHSNTVNPERITIRTAGWYFCMASISFNETFTTGKLLTLFVNAFQAASNHYATQDFHTSLTSAPKLQATHIWPMNIGDYFTVATSHNYGEARLLATHAWTSGAPTFAAVFQIASGLPTDI